MRVLLEKRREWTFLVNTSTITMPLIDDCEKFLDILQELHN